MLPDGITKSQESEIQKRITEFEKNGVSAVKAEEFAVYEFKETHEQKNGAWVETSALIGIEQYF